jgi:hypothetical protein
MYYNNETLHPLPRAKVLDPGGFYEFSPAGFDTVPIGIHKLVAKRSPTESLVRWVTVLPRSKTIVDFKFTSSFVGGLRMVGTPKSYQAGLGFEINVVNDNPTDVTVMWLRFLATSASLYMRDFRIGNDHMTLAPLAGPGDTVHFTPPGVTIAPNDEVTVFFNDFHVDSLGADAPQVVTGDTFKFRFSDGSEITVVGP